MNDGQKPVAARNYVLWEGSYVGNDLLFWKQGKRGYTTNLEQAHRFTREEAYAQHSCRKSDIPLGLDMISSGVRSTVSPEAMTGEARNEFHALVRSLRGKL